MPNIVTSHEWVYVDPNTYYCQDYGTLLRTSEGWYATNDTRVTGFLECVRSGQVCQPTVGPFHTATLAARAYEAAHQKCREIR